MLQGFDVILTATNRLAVNSQELAGWAKCIVDARNAMIGPVVKPCPIRNT